jgi:hypothetical protein
MDKRNSPITDLYGTSPEDYCPRRKSHTWLYVLMTITGFFAVGSIHPVMRLRPDPPPSVVGAGLNPAGASHESQMRTARVCWDYAIASVQDSYPYGGTLPRNPPSALKGKSGKASATSALCWPRLRNAWTRPESWVRTYEWSTDWFTNADAPFQRTISNILNRLTIGN